MQSVNQTYLTDLYGLVAQRGSRTLGNSRNIKNGETDPWTLTMQSECLCEVKPERCRIASSGKKLGAASSAAPNRSRRVFQVSLVDGSTGLAGPHCLGQTLAEGWSFSGPSPAVVCSVLPVSLPADSDASVGRCPEQPDDPSPAGLNSVDSNPADLNRVVLSQVVVVVCQVSQVLLTADSDASAGFRPVWLGDRVAAVWNPADSNRAAEDYPVPLTVDSDAPVCFRPASSAYLLPAYFDLDFDPAGSASQACPGARTEDSAQVSPDSGSQVSPALLVCPASPVYLVFQACPA
jgi:hypothetical protein